MFDFDSNQKMWMCSVFCIQLNADYQTPHYKDREKYNVHFVALPPLKISVINVLSKYLCLIHGILLKKIKH